MSINVMSTGYYPTGYTNNKTTKTETGKTFAEIASQKAAEADKEVAQEKIPAVLDSIGSQAPDEVKQAWKEAEAETGGHFGVGGFWISNDGKECQMTKMFVDRFVRWFNGDVNPDDMLGNSVDSAKSAVEKWLYDLDHPLIGQPTRSIEEQRMIQKEREFYEAFLDKLKNLSDSASKDSQNVSNYANRTYANIVPVKSVEADEEIVADKATAAFDTFGAYAPDEVRQAWKEAEEATGGHFAAGGLWISNDGKHAHATQIMLERAGSWLRGEAAQYNILGNSVESAISFAEKAIYGIDHPLAGQPAKSLEQQRLAEMERAFYEVFLEKLRQFS